MEQLKSYLTFKIGEEQFAANASYIHNIIELPKITKMPEMPDYMLGVINLRGKVLPVIDSRIKFGLTKTEITSNSCIIVMEIEIKGKELFLGFLVDAVSEVVEIEPEDIKQPPVMIGDDSKHISGVFEKKDKFCMILNMNIVLQSDVKINVNEMCLAES